MCSCGFPHLFALTLLHKGAVNKPHGIIECCRGHRSHGQPGWVEPVEQVHQDANEEHGARNACPQRQIEGRQAGKHVHSAFSLAQQNSHRIIHVACGEIYNALSLRRDGQSGKSHISSLQEAERRGRGDEEKNTGLGILKSSHNLSPPFKY